MARLARQHRVERRERIVVAAEIEQHVAAVGQRLEVIGIERERLVEARQRIRGALQRAEHEAEIGMRVRRRRRDLQRRRDQPLRLAGLAGLQLQQAEQMQRVELIGKALQDARIALLGGGELPLPVQRQCLLKRCRALLRGKFRHAV